MTAFMMKKQNQAQTANTKAESTMKQAMGLQILKQTRKKRMIMTIYRYTKVQRYQDLVH